MNWKEMQKYFEMEDDFSADERKAIDENPLKYLLSISLDSIKFPFADRNFATLKNKFYTPLNAFLARVIQRSRKEVAFNLSLINRTIKNESDRHPIKVSVFHVSSYKWILQINALKVRCMVISKEKYEEKYFDVIKQRKIYASTCSLTYEYKGPESKTMLERISSLDFVIPEKIIRIDKSGHITAKFITLCVRFLGKDEEVLNYFDISKCAFSSFSYMFNTSMIN